VELEVLHDEPGFAIAVRRNVALAYWWASPQLEWFQVIRATTWPYADLWPRGAGWINLIVGGRPSFSEEIRREAAELSKRDDIYELGTAHIVLLDVLRGSAVRAFLGTVLLMSRAKTPTRVFGNIDAAAQWLAPRLGEAFTADEMAEFCRACVDQLGK
jgi:hypothetical protein